jgi:hypothetical protein
MLMPIRSGLFKSINRAFPYLGRGCIVILAMVSIITTELSVSTTWSAASSVSSTETVNRTQKGERLPLVPTLQRNTVNLPLGHDELPVGCESLGGPLAHSPLAHISGRCLS